MKILRIFLFVPHLSGRAWESPGESRQGIPAAHLLITKTVSSHLAQEIQLSGRDTVAGRPKASGYIYTHVCTDIHTYILTYMHTYKEGLPYIYIHHILLFMRMMTPNMLMEMCWPQVCAQIKNLYDIM